MASYVASYMYLLHEDGNSTNGQVVAEIPNASSTSVEEIDDGIITVDENFVTTFDDPATQASLGGTYTYVGHSTTYPGVVVTDGTDFYLLSNSVIETNNFTGFTPEDFVVCFAQDTRILTPAGEVQIETLRPGQRVVTALGGQRIQELRWVGQRRIDIAGARDPRRVAPILLRAGSLGPGVPCRDLRVSPEHAFLIAGRLVPARLLVDGVTILQESWRREVTYWHLELERHGILVADGALAESYFDDGNRRFFNNPGLVALDAGVLRPPRGRYAIEACAPPILDAGDPALAVIRGALRAAA